MSTETHFFSYDEDWVIFYKDVWELMSQGRRPEDCYVYEGELDEDNYDDRADDYREQTAEEYIARLCWTCGKMATHRTFRDALCQYELTCDKCHREEYPEEYE
jgi:hypothetical protein